MSAPSAALQRLRLRTELRKARTAARLTQRQVAAKMEWSPSKLIRIEAGEVGISVNDLRPLLDAYGIRDRRKIEELLDLARGSRKMPYTEYRDLYSKEFLQFLALESSASIVRAYNSLQVPGPLQTEEYGRAIMRAYEKGIDDEVVERAIEVRLSRQETLTSGDREIFYILDESVVRRQVGGRGIMRAQLERLAELAALPNVSIQILPFSVGAHPGIQGPFTLFEFAADEMPDTLYLENPRGDSYSTNAPEESGRYLERFWELEDLAIKERNVDMLRMLAARAEEGVDELERLLSPVEAA
ncbi:MULTISPECIES: helix-turn-helix transcriptional regulator [Streptomyces]|uniref:Transcriptional regulator n=1 Tax=Streptomyces venezuelae TaxID=54571 RepID=A0A5P2BCY1_STRVZ|nr:MULTISPECIES: helix-turn-helix transcriptional regulator [Streptomyces]NEA06453.1 helix-turn-helix domain-containing protein [Streptomyces sp. SID10116]MYY82744.1 helix-turn-helix domain-containing protein [Streptomyces sp. SID335]MYZ15509.1 helix-turn-helix domain-containing protein [Streptomyces sp. SID337]MYZ17997.1 helix-turn-helix domain-containing protein [Streptomyces sp. SID337]NDZ83996.1 helix-turn-helix domain-containing protein [Streptomyces sp. SID10115]